MPSNKVSETKGGNFVSKRRAKALKNKRTPTLFWQLQHSASVLDEIRNAVAAAKEVTISEKPVAIGGWTGAGYAVIDPATGAGGYLIEGGAKGSVVEIENGLKTILGVTNTVTAYIGLAINIVANLIDCYGEEIRSVAMFFGIAAVVGILASVLSRSGAAGAAIGYASVAIAGVLATSSAQAGSKSRECKMDCKLADDKQLASAGILGIEHEFKKEHDAIPTSRYDICACKDGAIVIARSLSDLRQIRVLSTLRARNLVGFKRIYLFFGIVALFL